MNIIVYFWLSVVVLAALLFIPTSKLIWVVSVRKLQRKQQRELTESELQAQLQRSRFITVFVVLFFSFLFNYQFLGMPTNG